MTPPPETSPRAAPPSPSAAVMAGFLAVAVVTSIVDAYLLPSPIGKRGVRALHVAFATAQLLGCAAVVAASVAGWRHARSKREIPSFPFVLAAAAALSWATLPDDLGGLADRISATRSELVRHALIGCAAVAMAAVVALLGRASRASRAWIRRAPAAIVGLALAIANPLVLPHDYPGVHLAMALVAGIALAHALLDHAGAIADRLPSSRPARAAYAAIGAALVVSIAAPLPNAVLADMLRATGSVVAPFASRLARSTIRRADVPPSLAPWFEKRARGASIPPRGPRVLPTDGVVVLLTVDALRADVINSGKHDAMLPNLKALRDEGVRFTQARAPGSQTVPVVTGLFTGKYYTQLYWSGGTAKHAWSAADDSVRFPEVLLAAGVKTITLPTLREVHPMNGTVRGFREDKVAWRRYPGEPSPPAAAIAEKIVRRLARSEDDGPLFLYAHFVDAHAPYTRGGTDCEPFDCYLREVALVDAAIGDIREALEGRRYASRSVLIVTADHGEAFGEHGQRYHASTLYDELLRVPLLISGPAFPPHAIDTPVTLLDLGPTILEMYGLATPASWMGESLVRLLKNEPDELTRPIAADSGRLMQAMVFADGIKVIRNNRNHTVEMYDLAKDPGEETNLFDTAKDAEARLAIVGALFEANAFRKPGYAAPYRK